MLVLPSVGVAVTGWLCGSKKPVTAESVYQLFAESRASERFLRDQSGKAEARMNALTRQVDDLERALRDTEQTLSTKSRDLLQMESKCNTLQVALHRAGTEIAGKISLLESYEKEGAGVPGAGPEAHHEEKVQHLEEILAQRQQDIEELRQRLAAAVSDEVYKSIQDRCAMVRPCPAEREREIRR